MDKPRDELPVRDLYLASFIYAKGFKLLRLESEPNSRTVWFVFAGKEEAEKLTNQFWNREATIDVKAYAEAIRSLKDRLFSQR